MPKSPVYNGHEIERGAAFRLYRIDGTVEEHEAQRVLYVLRSDLGGHDKLPRRARDMLAADPELEKGQDGREWLRVTYHPRRYRDIKEALQKRQVQTWERDISPLRRHLAEGKVKLAEPGELRTMLFDLEVDDRKSFDDQRSGRARILSWSAGWMDGADDQGYHAWLEEENSKAERALIRRLLKVLDMAHLISAWNLFDYDLMVLKARCDRLGIEYDWGRLAALCMLEVWRKHFIRGASGEETTSFALGAIGENVLGHRKVDLKGEMRAAGLSPPVTGAGTYYAWKHARKLLVKYNDQDVRLMRFAERRKHFVHLQLTLAKLCRTFPSAQSLHVTHLADGVFVGLGRRIGVHWPDKPPRPSEAEREAWKRGDDKAKGALVLDVKEGRHSDMHMLDFGKMYPAIISCGNISMETRVGDDWDGPCSTMPNGARYRTDIMGAFPMVVEQFGKERDKWKKRVKEAKDETEQVDCLNRSNVFKVFMNALYGLLLSKLWSRYYDKDNGEAVTSSAKALLRIVVDEIADDGGYVVMGDTDGGGGCEFDPAKLCGTVADKAAQWARDHAWRKDTLVIEHETTFTRFFIGCKKRYAGVASFYKGAHLDEPKIEVKGYEYVRSDATRVVRTTQRWLIEQYLLEDAAADVIMRRMEELRRELLANEVGGDEMVVSQRLTKPTEEYDVKTPHVRIAEKIDGVQVGEKIPYIVTGQDVFKEGGKRRTRVRAVHPSEFDGTYDGTYVWNKKVLPPLQRLGEVCWPGAPWQALSLKKVRRRKADTQGKLFEVPVPRKELAVAPREDEQADDEIEADLLGAPEFTEQRVVVVLAKESKFLRRMVRKIVDKCPGDLPLFLEFSASAIRAHYQVPTDHRCDPDELRRRLGKVESARVYVESL